MEKVADRATEGSMLPLIRWAGSKRKLIPLLSQNLPPKFDRYVEPFAGSACFFFFLRPEKALLSDINEELIATYLAIKDDPRAVSKKLRAFKLTADEYYRLRSQQIGRLSPASRAARFLYLNRFCFNGLYRTNLKGEFNVPYGPTRSGLLPSAEKLESYSRVLAGVEIVASKFESIIEQLVPGDFVYLDPPYSVKSVRTFRQYSNHNFCNDQIHWLRSRMIHLDKQGIPFLVSYAESDEGRVLSDGFRCVVKNVRRQIAGFASHRKFARELLIRNY